MINYLWLIQIMICKQSWKWFKRSIDLIGPGGQPFRYNKSLVEWLLAAFYLSSLPLKISKNFFKSWIFRKFVKKEVPSMEVSRKNEATSH